MKTQEMYPVQEDQKQVELIKGEFTPTEAGEILSALIDQKIHFHEVRKFQRWEKDHDCGTEDLTTRIKELKQEKAKVRAFIQELAGSEKCVKINGLLEITVHDQEQ